MVRRIHPRGTRGSFVRRAPLAALPLGAVASIGAVGGITAGSTFLSLATTSGVARPDPTLASTALTDPSRTITLVPTTTTLAVLVGAYLVACFVGTFFSAALVAAAHDRATGGAGRATEGLRVASYHAPQLLAWAVIAGTVGVVARQFGHRGVLGFALGRPTRRDWHDASELVLPLIVHEGLSPWRAWQRSRHVAGETFEPRTELRAVNTLVALTTAFVAVMLLWPASPVIATTVAAIAAVTLYVHRATATGVRRATSYRTSTSTSTSTTVGGVDEVAAAIAADLDPAVALAA